jgi:hypothetical protein
MSSRQAGVQTKQSHQVWIRKVFISSSVRPAPRATQLNGSSAIETGSPVAWRKTTSRLPSSAPPPVKTRPLSTMSAANSGAVCSRATLTASTIDPTGSAKLSEIWRSLITISYGTPFIRSRPLISMIRPRRPLECRQNQSPSLSSQRCFRRPADCDYDGYTRL